jgi:Uncharacterised protein family (UPF0158)
MNREQVDLEGLVAAIETELPDVEHYLDLRSGEILTVVKKDPWVDTGRLDTVALENLALSRRIREEPEAFEQVPSIAIEAGFQWMKEFSATVEEKALRERLEGVLYECTDGCFKEFRREIMKAPENERERWFAFRDARLKAFVVDWLEGNGKAERAMAVKAGD